MKKIKNILLGIIIPVLILLLWWYVTNFTDTPSTILPKISAVGERLRLMIENGQLHSRI